MKTMWKTPVALLGGAALGLAAASAPASAQTVADIQAQLQELQEKVNELQTKVEKPDYKVSTKGGIKVESQDGNFSASVGGRIMVDYATYDQDKSRLGDGAEIRRARLKVEGTLFKDWGYKTEIDFAGNGVAFKDAYLKYSGEPIKPVSLQAGQFKEPFGLERLTSSRFITFTERSVVSEAFTPEEQLGVMAMAAGENWTYALGAFSGDGGTNPAGEIDEGWDIASRATFAPIYEGDQSIHLGFGVRFRQPNAESMRFRSRSDTHVTDVRFVDTGNLANVESQIAWGPELALVYGPFSVQAEYINQDVSRAQPRDDLTFKGYYVYVSYFLTGESRNYEAKSGKFDRVKPIASLGKLTEKSAMGYGAWEIALRFDSLDLTDGSVNGGGQKDITAGLNWYANPYVRFMFNYVHVNNDNKATGNSANLLPGVTFAGDDDPDVFQVRAQVDF